MRGRHTVLLLVVSLVAPLPVGASGREQAPRVIRLVSITTSERTRDVPPRGLSKGDTEFSTSRLLNAAPQFGKPKGAVVGSDRGTTTVASSTRATVDGLTTLPGGTLTLRGTVRFIANGQVFPVVAGAGAFEGAHGTVTVTGLGQDQGKALNVYRLSYR